MIYDENNPKNNSNVNHIGYDNRYPKNYTDPIDIGKIIKIFQQNKWLSILTNQNISINDKLKIVYIMDFYNIKCKTRNSTTCINIRCNIKVYNIIITNIF